MARTPSPHPGPAGALPQGGALGLALGTCAASLLLVAPVVVWARFGDAGALSTLGVAVGALGACVALLRLTARRYLRRRLPALAPQTRRANAAAPAAMRMHGLHLAAPSRARRTAATPRGGGPNRCRPVYVSRFARDVGCRAAARSLRGRTARRRTRP